MTNYEINSSLAAYQPKTSASIVNRATNSDNASISSKARNDSESFVQNVIQSLQGLGLNTSDVTTETTDSSIGKEALQNFLQTLSKALNQNKNPQTLPVIASENDGVETNSTKVSGGSNFRYNIDLSEADLGTNLEDVKANIKTALDNIGQHISSKAVFNLKVLTEHVDDHILAQTSSSLVSIKPTLNGSNVDTTFVADTIRGADSSPKDATLYINLARIDEMSFNGEPTPEKFDLTTILTHEILHGLAFTGGLNSNPDFKSVYDSLVTTENGMPFFVGRHATRVNSGMPIPLAPAEAGEGSALYHVSIPSDLMSTSIQKGEVKSISPLDVAMLQDMGVDVMGTPATTPAIEKAYGDPTTNLRNLMTSVANSDALKVGFSNLVESLGGSSLTTNLQDFLAHLASNVENNNTLPNGSGSLLSVVA